MSWTAKRFWKEARVQAEGDGFTVRLDGRGVKTPAKAAFVMPTRAMAEASAAEWDAQEETIDPLTMPVTRAVNAAIDKVSHQFDEVAEMLAAYGDADLTCYRAASPVALVARQAEVWDPLLDWAEKTYGARLSPVAGVMHAPQDAAALARLRAPLFAMTPFELTAMHDLVSLSGSLVIGLSAFTGAQTKERLWLASRTDELWQIEQWGADDLAEEEAALKEQAFFDAVRFKDLTQR